MASKLVDGLVVEEQLGERRLWRVVGIDEPRRARAPTEAEMAAGGMSAPPPRHWGLDGKWRPIRRGGRGV